MGTRQSGAVRVWLTPNHRSQFVSFTAANALAISPFGARHTPLCRRSDVLSPVHLQEPKIFDSCVLGVVSQRLLHATDIARPEIHLRISC